MLAGRERVHPAETLLERARLDLEQGRLEGGPLRRYARPARPWRTRPDEAPAKPASERRPAPRLSGPGSSAAWGVVSFSS